MYLDLVESFSKEIRLEKLKTLEDKKIIKRYSIDGRPVVEIIHDKYALAVKSERDFRLKAAREELALVENQKQLEQQREKDERDLQEKKLALQVEQAEYDLQIQKQQAVLKDQQLKLKEKRQRWLYAIAAVLLLLGAVTFYSLIRANEANKLDIMRLNTINKQNDSLIRKGERIRKLEQIKDSSLSVINNKNDALNKALTAANQQREIAEMNSTLARNRAFSLAEKEKQLKQDSSILSQRNISLGKFSDSITNLLRKYTVSDTVGELFASAKKTQLTSPVISYQLAKFAQRLDPQNLAVKHFLDTLTRSLSYYTIFSIKGTSPKFSPNGDRFLTFTKNGGIAIYDSNGNLKRELYYDQHINSAQFSSDGESILMTSGQYVYLYNLKADTPLTKYLPGLKFATFLTRYPDRFAVVEKNDVRFFYNNGEEILTVSPKDTIYNISTDSSKLYVNVGHAVDVYNLGSNELIEKIEPAAMHKGADKISTFFVAPNANQILYFDGGYIELWDEKMKKYNTKLIAGVSNNHVLNTALFSPDGASMYALFIYSKYGSGNSVVQQQQQQQQQQQETSFGYQSIGDDDPNINMLISLDTQPISATKIVSSSSNRLGNPAFSYDGQQFLYSYSTSVEIRKSDRTEVFLDEKPPIAINMGPDKNMIFTSYDNNTTIAREYGLLPDLDVEGKLKKFSDDELYQLAGIKRNK